MKLSEIKDRSEKEGLGDELKAEMHKVMVFTGLVNEIHTHAHYTPYEQFPFERLFTKYDNMGHDKLHQVACGH